MSTERKFEAFPQFVNPFLKDVGGAKFICGGTMRESTVHLAAQKKSKKVTKTNHRGRLPTEISANVTLVLTLLSVWFGVSIPYCTFCLIYRGLIASDAVSQPTRLTEAMEQRLRKKSLRTYHSFQHKDIIIQNNKMVAFTSAELVNFIEVEGIPLQKYARS